MRGSPRARLRAAAAGVRRALRLPPGGPGRRARDVLLGVLRGGGQEMGRTRAVQPPGSSGGGGRTHACARARAGGAARATHRQGGKGERGNRRGAREGSRERTRRGTAAAARGGKFGLAAVGSRRPRSPTTNGRSIPGRRSSRIE